MAIEIVDGRPRSVRTDQEVIDEMIDAFEQMSVDEQIAVLHYLNEFEDGNDEAIDQYIRAEYDEEPVDPRTFLLDEYYLGAVGNSMWPKLQEDFIDLFEGGYYEAILTGSLGFGKSFFCTCGVVYVLYQISCLANPQEVYGLAQGTSISVALLSVTRDAAKRVPMAEVAAKIQLSPYFKEKVPYKITHYEIRFPSKKMMVVAGSTASAAIGTNVFSGFLDEMAFMGSKKAMDKTGRLVEVDKSEVLTKAIVRRMKSRFQRSGKLPGIMFLASSKEKPIAFIEKKIEDARMGKDPGVFVRDYATWDVKPPDNFSPKRFFIAVGNETTRSKIDPSDDEVEWYRDNGLRVIDVPEDYRPDFESDLEGSLRDIAGVATETVSLFIHRREKIAEAVDESLPFVADSHAWQSSEPLMLYWNRIAVPFERPIPGGYTEDAWRPIRHPGAIRYAHVDPSLSGDSAGLAIAHIAGWTEVIRRDGNGEEYTETAPVIETDFLLSIIPPPGDEIFLPDLRSIIYQFMEHGFVISFASMDSFQSAESLQQLRRRGVETDLISMDKTTEPYDVLKTTLYEDRIRMHNNPIIARELRQLQRVQATRGIIPRFKIDHPADGTKDLSDALAGVVYSLTTRMPGRPMPIVSSARATADDVVDHSWVTGGKVMVSGSSGTKGGNRAMVSDKASEKKPVMPFIRG